MPPAKVIKTERTHQENQERAYIAASRRSDRSLEARVESARRASEIHKRRTGRSLRVTEEDVQNEEMYEEEDDDLPLQYRRLTAHLRTGSADFNRRLSAYLTNHVAMRTALQHSIDNSYAQQYPNAPQFANQQSIFPSPMLAHQGQQQMMQPPYSPSTYGTAPYQSLRPQQQNFQPSPHHRSASIAIPHELPSTSRSTPVVNSDNGRRMSMPTAPSTASPVEARTSLSASSATPQSRPSFPPGSFSQSQLQRFALPSYDMGAFGHTRFSPFSTALPADTLGLLGSTLDYKDPLTSVMMAGNSNLPGNFYDFNNQSLPQTTSVGKHQVHPSFDGLNSTLAPSALELSQANDAQNQSFFENAMKDGSQGITPAGTPGVNGESWGNFIDDSAWDIP